MNETLAEMRQFAESILAGVQGFEDRVRLHKDVTEEELAEALKALTEADCEVWGILESVEEKTETR